MLIQHRQTETHVYWLCYADLIFTYLTNFFTCKSKSQFVNILHWYKVSHPQISLFYFILISLYLARNWYLFDSYEFFFLILQHKLTPRGRVHDIRQWKLHVPLTKLKEKLKKEELLAPSLPVQFLMASCSVPKGILLLPVKF